MNKQENLRRKDSHKCFRAGGILLGFSLFLFGAQFIPGFYPEFIFFGFLILMISCICFFLGIFLYATSFLKQTRVDVLDSIGKEKAKKRQAAKLAIFIGLCGYGLAIQQVISPHEPSSHYALGSVLVFLHQYFGGLSLVVFWVAVATYLIWIGCKTLKKPDAMQANKKNNNPSIGLYAICYADSVHIPEGFIRYDCRDQPHEDEREVFHMVDFYRNREHLKYDITALLSPEYTNKTHVKGFQVAGFISENPGFDLYLLDPFRFIHTYSYFNVWEQVESWCPGFIEIANQLLAVSGYQFSVSNFPRQTFSCVGYCNYWAANKEFWDAYMDFINPMIEALKKDKEADRIFYRYVVPWRNKEISVIPFILERMLSTFLTLNPNFKVINCGRGLNIPEDIIYVMKLIDQHDEDGRYNQDFHDLQSIVREKYK